MSRGFTDKTIISPHNKSYAIHPNKLIIESMGWKKGDILRVIPIPEKGLICLKGKRIRTKTFSKKFRVNFVRNNKTKYKKIVKILHSFLRNKFQGLDYIIYKKEFKKYLQSLKEIEKILEEDDITKTKENIRVDNLIK